MSILNVSIFLFTVSFCNAEILRICEVAKEPSANFQRMTLINGEVTEVVFVSKNTIVSDSDIVRATPVPETVGQIDVHLTEKGALKLQSVTDRMVYGRDRLALIVDGRLVSNPVVQATLGSSLRIAGLKHLNAEELANLARRIAAGSSGTKNEKTTQPIPAPSE